MRRPGFRLRALPIGCRILDYMSFQVLDCKALTLDWPSSRQKTADHSAQLANVDKKDSEVVWN